VIGSFLLVGRIAAKAQESDQPTAKQAPQAATAEDEPQRAESVGAKTGLKIFGREKAESSPDAAASTAPSLTLDDDAVDWLGALGQLWNDWRAGTDGQKSAVASRDGRRPFMSRAFVRQHDADKNGDLSHDEIPASMENAFAHLDADHDGSLTRAEIRQPPMQPPLPPHPL